MTNTDSITPADCISLLRRVRDKAATSTTSQLLDYIDGQIDALESVYTSLAIKAIAQSVPQSNSPWEPAEPKPWENNEVYQNDDKYVNSHPRQYTNSAPCDNVSTTVARFRGADMD